MNFLIAVGGLVLCYVTIKYRESIANSIGNFEWMRYFGGPQSFVAIIGMLFFIWSVAAATGTQGVFLAPLIWLLGGNRGGPPPPPDTLY